MKGKRPHMSTTSKALHVGYLLLAISPRIEDTVSLAEGRLTQKDYVNYVIQDYTGYNPATGNLDIKAAARGWAPVGAAFILSKVVGMARKRWKF